MRIAQIAPLAEAVPPKLYGGTERVIWWLTEALVDLGHDVTLFASGDSATSARLVPCAETGLRLAGINDHLASLLAMLDRVLARADQFDILHFHIDFLHFPTFRHLAGKCLTTLHGRQDLPDFWPAYRTFPEMPLVSISDDQRAPIADAQLRRHDPSRPARAPDPVQRGAAATISPSSAGSRPRSGPTGRSRSPGARA